MAKLTLWFAKQAGMAACELERTSFIGNPFSDEIIAVRGKTPGAYRDAGTFQWTPGVKALSVIFLIAVSRHLKQNKGFLPLLGGGRGSLAASLDYALNKQPEWLFDMFGADEKGNSYLRQLLLRSNSGRRRTGPVRISLNEQILPPQSVKVYVADKLIEDGDELERLAASIMSDDYVQPANDIAVPNPYREEIDLDKQIFGRGQMFPVIVPVTDEDIGDINDYERVHFPQSHATRQRLMEWHRHDPNNYMCIKEAGASFMAYYLILFLKPGSLKKYLDGDITEIEIGPDDLLPANADLYARQDAVHICCFASRIHASMFTVDLLWHLIGRLLELSTSGALSTIYAEPATKEGQALLNRFGFDQVNHHSKGNPILELKITPSVLREWEERYRSRTFCRTPMQPQAWTSLGRL